jgi:uncharacterized membrane protein HdeD (DUF308 family)
LPEIQRAISGEGAALKNHQPKARKKGRRNTVSTTSIVTMAKQSISWSIGLSVLMIVAGILAIVVPPVAGIAATILIGWLLIVMGVLHWVFGWHTRTVGGAVWGLLLGMVYGAVGIYMLFRPIAGLAGLTLALGAYLFVEAILEFALWWRARPMAGAGWLLVDGVVTLILSVLIWITWPSNSPWVIGTLLGISMIFSGSSRLMLLLAAKRVVATA